MDGEFDRELDDGGWGNSPKRPWKTLSDQIKVMEMTISKEVDKKGREKAVTEARERMFGLIKCAGYNLEDRRSLGELFWRKEKEHGSQAKEAARQKNEAGRLKKGKWEKQEKKEEEDRRIWWKLAVLWQGIDHLHREPIKKKGSSENETKTCLDAPPAYSSGGTVPTAPVAPVTHMCPQFTITSGTVLIESDRRGQGQMHDVSRNGESVAKERDDVTRSHSGEEEIMSEGQETDSEGEEECPASTPFGARVKRAQLKKRGARMSGRERLYPLLNRQESSRVEVAGALTGVWETDPSADSRGGLESARVDITGTLSGILQEDPPLRDDDLVRACEAELQRLQDQIEQKERASIGRRDTRQEGGRKHHMTTRSRTLEAMQLPLLREAGQMHDRYKPFSIGDVQALTDKLPPPAEGGRQWLEKLDQLTTGQNLALGDFRAVAARSMGKHTLLEIEARAGVLRREDNIELTRVIMKLGDALREMFPAPSGAVVPKFFWDPKLHPREYLDDCKEDWTRRTGCHPGQKGYQREWFRRAVLEGVPEGVRNAMLDSPDLPGAESQVWDRHLVHHLQRAKEEVHKEESEVKQLQSQLLKLQVGEARKKATEEKKKGQSKQMVAGVQPEGPPLQPPGPWYGPPTYQQGGWGQQWGRGRGAWGRGYRGRGGRRGALQGGQRPGACYRCGGTGHWSRDCLVPAGTAGQNGSVLPGGQGPAVAPQVIAPHAQAAPTAQGVITAGQFPFLASDDWDGPNQA